MSKTKRHSKVIYILVALALLLSVGIVAMPMASKVEAQSANYDAPTIEKWLISQIKSTKISLSTSPTVSLDAGDNTMTINVTVIARGTTLELNNVKFIFDGTNKLDITGELSVVGRRPRFSCEAELECKVAEDKMPQVRTISNIQIGGFEPSLSEDTLKKIADTINNAIRVSGLKVESLGGDLTGINVILEGGEAKLELRWSGGSVKLDAAVIQDRLNEAAIESVNRANDYFKNGYDEGKWLVDVSIGGGQLTFEAEATALGRTAKIEDMSFTFSGTRASITGKVSGPEELQTVLATATIACTNYVPRVTVTRLGGGHEYPEFKDWIEGTSINSALRDALNRLATNVIDDTNLRSRIRRFNNIAIVDETFRLWYKVREEAPPAPPGPPAPPATGTGSLSLAALISPEGIISRNLTLFSADRKVRLTIPKGTQAVDKESKLLDELMVETKTTYPTPPPGGNVIGLAYDFTPDGGTFAPPIDMVFTYQESDLPSGVVERDLKVHFWNGTAWEGLPSTVDPVVNTVTAKVSNFGDCLFAVMWIAPAPPAPAYFTLADLSISARKVRLGKDVTVWATVSNVGGTQGTYVVELKVNGVVEASESVTLAPNQSTAVSFTVSKDQRGTYQVEVDGLKASFTVEEVMVPLVLSWISRYWWTIVVGVGVVGLLVYFLWWRRRRAVT